MQVTAGQRAMNNTKQGMVVVSEDRDGDVAKKRRQIESHENGWRPLLQ